jgi:hypothetical protein
VEDKAVVLINRTVIMANKGNGSLENMLPKHTGLELFVIQGLTLEKREEGGVQMVIVLKRKTMIELLTTYVPSILLLLLTFSTTFLELENLDVVVGTNVTIMLLILTIFTSKIEELPPTSAIKMIDIWLLGCLVYPFLQVLIQIALKRLVKEGGKEEKHCLEEEVLEKDAGDGKARKSKEGKRRSSKEGERRSSKKTSSRQVSPLMIEVEQGGPGSGGSLEPAPRPGGSGARGGRLLPGLRGGLPQLAGGAVDSIQGPQVFWWVLSSRNAFTDSILFQKGSFFQ